MTDKSLKQKAASGIKWSLIENISNRGVTFIIGIVLARLLAPEDYGLIGIVLTIIACLNAIVDGGFSQALIRSQNINDKEISSIFFFNLTISLGLSLLLFFFAGTLSNFIAANNQLTAIMKVMSCIVFIQSFSIIQQTLLIKNIDFKSLTIVGFTTSIISGTIGLTLAYHDYGVWSLVAQQISKSILTVLLLWIISKWRPILYFSLKHINRFLSFSWKLSLVNVIDAIWQSINVFAVGKYFSLTTLGYYSKAEQFDSITSKNFSNIIHRVMYPVLVSVQDQETKLVSAYKKYFRLFLYVMSLGSFCLAAISYPLIDCLLGDKWLQTAEYLKLICISGFIFSLHWVCLNLLKVKGRSDYLLILDILRKALLLASIVIGVYFESIHYLLYCQIGANIFSFLLDCFAISRQIDYKVRDQLLDGLKFSFLAVIIAAVLLSILLINLPSFALLLIQICLGIVLICIISKIIRLDEYSEIKRLILKR